MSKKESDYQEGWDDALQYAEKAYIKLTEVEESFNKLFDRISSLKLIQTHILNHFNKNIGIDGKEFKEPTDKKKNLKEILTLIEKDLEVATEV